VLYLSIRGTRLRGPIEGKPCKKCITARVNSDIAKPGPRSLTRDALNVARGPGAVVRGARSVARVMRFLHNVPRAPGLWPRAYR
jgi:hypothetical protein